MTLKTNIKEKLYDYCLGFVEQRISTARQAMKEAQDSASGESKSSAGDKYETGRAMMHLENEKHARQLEEGYKLQRALRRVDLKACAVVQPGSLAITNQGNFYLAISAGKISMGSLEYFAISPVSPLGQALTGLKKDETVVFNKRTFLVKDIL